MVKWPVRGVVSTHTIFINEVCSLYGVIRGVVQGAPSALLKKSQLKITIHRPL